MDFFFGAAARDSEEGDQVIDPAQLKYLWTQKLTNTTAGACSSYLAARLLGMGFKYVSDSGLVQSSEFLRHQKQVLIPFAKKALEHLLVQGFVVYGVTPRYKTRGNLASPYVCTSDHFTAKKSHASNGGETLSVTHKGSNKKLYCFVLDSPTSDGTLTSRLALVSKQISYLDDLEKTDIQAYSIRARPPVLTKAKTDTSFDSRDVISGSVPGFRAQEEEDNMGVRNQITAAQFKQQQQLIRTLNDRQINTSSGFWTNDRDPSQMSRNLESETIDYVPKFIPLPNDSEVAKFDLPEEKKDLVHVQKYIKGQICMGMGVPEHFISPSGTGAGFGEKSMRLSNEYMRMSISPIKEAINLLMIHIYEVCFGTEDNVSHDVECYFPSTQNPEMILELYKSNLLTKKTLARTFGPIYDLDSEDMFGSDF